MNEVTVQGETFSLVPRNLGEAMEFAKIIASSDMVPKDYVGKPGNVLVAVQTGAEVGLKPMQSLQGIAVINGRPAIWGDAMWALVLSHPDFEDSNEELTDTKCTIRLKRRGRSEVVRSFSLEDAKKAGLAGKQGPWTTATKRMMQMRARAFACRDLFADALKGIKSVEEVRDYPAEPERNMGNAEIAVTLQQKWIAKANEATSADDLGAIWKEGLAEIKAAGDMPAYEAFKAAVESKGKSLKTAQQPAITPEMEGLVADLESAADEGIEAFVRAWDGLSDQTKAALESAHARLKTRSEEAEARK